MARRDDDDRLGSARDEAERLIAAALAAASFASRQAARRSRERDRGRRDDSLGDDLAGLAGAATRLVGGWLGTDRDRDSRRANDRYDDRFDGYDRRDADRDRRGDADSRTTSTHHVANGSDACCSCPVCRTIDFVREPSPEFVERLATGASDLASGVTSVLRAFGDVTGVGRRDPRRRATRADVVDDFPVPYPNGPATVDPLVPEPTMAEPTVGEPAPPADEADDVPGASEPAHTVPPTPPAGRRFGGRLGGDFSSVWQAATRAPMSDPARRAPQTPKPMAKKAVKAPGGVPSEPPRPDPNDATGRPAKAARTKAAPTKSVPTKSVPTKSLPTKSVPTKAASTRAATSKATTSEGTASKATATKASTTKATATKSSAAKAGVTKATATKAGATKADATKAGATKATATKKVTPRTDSGTKTTAAKAQGKAAATKSAPAKAAGNKSAAAKAAAARKAAATKKAAPATPRTTRQLRG